MYSQTLAFGLLLIAALFVSIQDVRTFRIANRALFLVSFPSIPALLVLGQHFSIHLEIFIVAAALLVLGLKNLLGMGDVKLLTLLLPWLHQDHLVQFLIFLTLFAWLEIPMIMIKSRKMPSRVAMAPAILIAAALNMAT
jgi:Flp pilus assembly protein protease CpaA